MLPSIVLSKKIVFTIPIVPSLRNTGFLKTLALPITQTSYSLLLACTLYLSFTELLDLSSVYFFTFADFVSSAPVLLSLANVF